MDRRTILAVLLITLIWIGWYFLNQQLNPPEEIQQKTVQQSPEKERIDKATGKEVTEGRKEPSPQKGEREITVEEAPAEEKTFTYSTEKYDITFTSRGAAISSMVYREREVELTVAESMYNTKGKLDFAIHFNNQNFVEGNSLDRVNWSPEKTENGVRFQTTVKFDGKPVVIEKNYIFDTETYQFTIEYSFHNKGKDVVRIPGEEILISPAEIIGPDLDYSNTYNRLRTVYYLGDDYEEESKGGGFFSKRESLVTEKGAVQWFGVMSRYFLVIMMPKNEKGTGIIFDNRENEGYRIASRFSLPKINPGSSEVRAFTVYIGEKKKETLVAVDETMKKASDINLFIEPIRWFVLWSLKKINIIFGNMGWALVFFSLLTKIVFLPLTRKSTESMKKMQELNPQLTKIKEKYKDKPDVMQQKMMELYKENKVNPMGGCFPLLLQMPFFLALYSALINSIDLWNAPFILWMQDLSMPDTVATVAGFNINILPLVMTISTILQQKLTTVDTGQQQKMMMYMLPLILIFIFWTMPSGLVLYWTLQNLFQVLHQVIINYRSKKA